MLFRKDRNDRGGSIESMTPTFTSRHRASYAPSEISHCFFLITVMAHKYCELNGTWYRHPESNQIWSNYTTCVNLQDLSVSNISYMLFRPGERERLAVEGRYLSPHQTDIERYRTAQRASEHRRLLSESRETGWKSSKIPQKNFEQVDVPSRPVSFLPSPFVREK